MCGGRRGSPQSPGRASALHGLGRPVSQGRQAHPPAVAPHWAATSSHAACVHVRFTDKCRHLKTRIRRGGGTMLRNRMRAGIERGEAQIGTWLTLVRDPSILMLMKAAGLDFARVDMEHTSLGIETIGQMA